MRRGSILIAIVFLTAIATPAQSAPSDFASLRKAADTYAAKDKPGSKLWKIDVVAAYPGDSLEIREEVFYYAYEHPQGLDAIKVHVLPLEGMHLPKVESRTPGHLTMEKWQMAAVPANILSPEEALRRLNRKIPPGFLHSTGGLLRRADDRRDFALKLVYAGTALADSSRNQLFWTGLNVTLGVPDAQFFARTAPLGRWVWWTIVMHERPNPQRIGGPDRVQEYIYIDAMTAKATSHCLGQRGSIACPTNGTAQTAKPERGSLLMTTGEVKSASPEKLVIVTDRNITASLKRGTEMTFIISQPHLQKLNLQKGDHVTIRYENQSGRMVAQTITIRPSERP